MWEEEALEDGVPEGAAASAARQQRQAVRAAARAEKARGFDPGRALRGLRAGKGKGGGAGDAEVLRSACTTRGDGKYGNGTHFLREGNKVQIGPNAFDDHNREDTLRQLAEMGAFGGKSVAQARADALNQAAEMMAPGPAVPPAMRKEAATAAAPAPAPAPGREEAGGGAPAAAAAKPAEDFNPLSMDQLESFAKLMVEAGEREERSVTENLHEELYDLQEPEAPGPEVGGSHFKFEQPVVPEHTLTQCETSDGERFLEVVVALPKVEGGGEVALDVLPKRASVVVGSKYRLKLPLPYAVDHKRVKAKWKAKAKKLKVTLRAAVAL